MSHTRLHACMQRHTCLALARQREEVVLHPCNHLAAECLCAIHRFSHCKELCCFTSHFCNKRTRHASVQDARISMSCMPVHAAPFVRKSVRAGRSGGRGRGGGRRAWERMEHVLAPPCGHLARWMVLAVQQVERKGRRHVPRRAHSAVPTSLPLLPPPLPYGPRVSPQATCSYPSSCFMVPSPSPLPTPTPHQASGRSAGPICT